MCHHLAREEELRVRVSNRAQRCCCIGVSQWVGQGKQWSRWQLIRAQVHGMYSVLDAYCMPQMIDRV